MTFLYYIATYLAALKIHRDLGAWQAESSRWMDLFAFLVLLIVVVILATATASPLKPVTSHFVPYWI